MKDIKNPNKTTQRRNAITLPSVNTFFKLDATILVSLSCLTCKGKKEV